MSVLDRSKIKKIVKSYLVRTKYWQKNRMGKKYYNSTRYIGLAIDEQTPKRVCYNEKRKIDQYTKMLENIKITLRENKRFQYWLDTGYYFVNGKDLNDSCSPDYSIILNYSLHELIEVNCKNDNKINIQNKELLYAIEEYIKRVIYMFDNVITCNPHDEMLINSRKYFINILEKPAKTLEEGLQRILFWSSLFWQSEHRLIGLGRLDVILKELELPEENYELNNILVDFLKELHRYYSYKSNTILGDTGQLIILGGINEHGDYLCNRLTYAFINAMMQVKIPDPKLLLRVSNNMPTDLLQLALKCVGTGIGSPLFANDEVIIPALVDFGYTKTDACNYVTSACWEPLSYAKSWGRANMGDINFAQVLVNTYQDNRFIKCKSFDEVLALYKEKLSVEVLNVLKIIDMIEWEFNPLMTLFTKGCIEKQLDVSRGGAIYCDYGILSVGLGNAVDSLMNIKEIVFDKKQKYLEELKCAVESNYEKDVELQKMLKGNSYFGSDSPYILSLVMELVDVVVMICDKYRNKYGGMVKFGLSSPNYMVKGSCSAATFDGRKNGEPLSVHISSRDAVPYTQLLNFSAKLKYKANQCNGSVVDFFVVPSFIESNFDKFVSMIKTAIKLGFFEMQMNVVSSKILIDAKNNPEKYPNLIVRVWGFSAYFNDLTEEYQNILIQRAIDSEKVL